MIEIKYTVYRTSTAEGKKHWVMTPPLTFDEATKHAQTLARNEASTHDRILHFNAAQRPVEPYRMAAILIYMCEGDMRQTVTYTIEPY